MDDKIAMLTATRGDCMAFLVMIEASPRRKYISVGRELLIDLLETKIQDIDDLMDIIEESRS